MHFARPARRALAAAMLACLATLPALSLDASEPASAAPPPGHDPAAAIAAQRQAMARLAFLDGAWRGPARHVAPDGSVHEMVQTERVGTLLDGSLRLIEGRGYDADGNTVFNAFAVLSWHVARQAYVFRSHAMGRSGEHAFRATDGGFVWEIAAGPATIRYTATVGNGTWHEVGERIVAGREPQRFFEMTLQRIGDGDWPAGGAVPAR